MLSIVTREDLIALGKRLEASAETNGLHTETIRQKGEANVYRHQLKDALETCDFHASDRSILDRVFTMLDKTGDDMIHYQELLVSIAPLVRSDFEHKLDCK